MEPIKIGNLDLEKIIRENRRVISWIVVALATLWLSSKIKEVVTLLVVAYGLALLIEPLVQRFVRRRFSRSSAVFLIGSTLLMLVTLFFILAIPVLVKEYSVLVGVLPKYITTLYEKFSALVEGWFGLTIPVSADEFWHHVQEYASAISLEQIRKVVDTLSTTLLSGYSVTLTILNLTLLPFFVYYIARDLPEFHRFLGRYIRDDIEEKVVRICREILSHVYAFVQGQITVSFCMAGLYALGLWLVGLPSGLVVGFVAGVLNLIPYLGVATGSILATIIGLVNGYSFVDLCFVWGVFVVVQAIEGSFLTPKIVGERVGIHPLVVMVALIIGGKLFGLLGLIIAIPGAAMVKVVATHLLVENLLPEEELAKLASTEAAVELPGG